MYVIVRRQEGSAVRLTHSPSVIHQHLAEARAEALRLAALNINTYFDVFSLLKVGSAYGRVGTEWNEIEEWNEIKAPIRKKVPVRIHSHNSKRK